MNVKFFVGESIMCVLFVCLVVVVVCSVCLIVCLSLVGLVYSDMYLINEIEVCLIEGGCVFNCYDVFVMDIFVDDE